MKPIEELLKNLARPEVLEFGLVTNRLPSVNVGGRFEPVDDEAPSTGKLLEILGAVGGQRHVETLGDTPVKWTTRVDGLGLVAVAAIMRKDVVQARFTVVRRDPARPLGALASATSSAAQPAARKEPQGVSGQTPQHPVGASGWPQPATGPSQTGAAKPQGSPARPSVQAPSNKSSVPPQPGAAAASSGALKVAPPGDLAPGAAPPPKSSNPLADAVPPPDDWDEDDDEPTVQTLSPPVAPRPALPPVANRHEPQEVSRENEASREAALLAAPRADRDSPPEPSRPQVPSVPPLAQALGAPKREGGPIENPAAQPTGPGHPVRPRGALDVEKEVTGTKKLALDLEEDFESAENTVEIAPSGAKLPVAQAASPSVEAAPTTSPSADVRDEGDPDGASSLDTYLALATAARATDLHLVAGRPVLLRVAGELLAQAHVVSPEHVERVVRAIVPPRLFGVLETDGACDFALRNESHGRFRVNVSRQRTGYKISMRVVAREAPTLAALGLPEALAEALSHPSGLVLVSSPAGHGKTTTLAALVDHVNRESARHVITIEDPIELVHARKRGLVTQREVGTHARSVEEALRAALHEDPDVLVVDAVGSAESVRRVLDACDAGCLVLACVGASGADNAILRLVDVFDDEERSLARARLASALRLVVGQRLVPSADGARLHAAVEIVPWSVALYACIRDGRRDELIALLRRGNELGVTRLDESLAALVRAERITVDVAKKLAESPHDLDRLAARASSAPSPAGKV